MKTPIDQVGAGQRLLSWLGHMELNNGQRFDQSFAQAARRTRIQMHEFAMQAVECGFRRRIVVHRVMAFSFLAMIGFVVVGQMVETLRRLCTWQRWIGAASPAYFFTAAGSALPPSST